MKKNEPAGIGIDIDGVLTDVEEFMEKRVNLLFKMEYGEGNRLFTSYNIEEVDAPENVKRFVEYALDGPNMVPLLEKIPKDLLKELNILGMLRPLYIITGRQKCFPQTVDFFQRECQRVAGVVNSFPDDKWMQVKGLDITLMVEDNLEEARAITGATDAYVILINKGYNVHEPEERIIPVDDFESALFMVYELWKKGVI